jgi:hypothetical protein
VPKLAPKSPSTLTDTLHIALGVQPKASSPSTPPPALDPPPTENSPESAPSPTSEAASESQAGTAEKVFVELLADCAHVTLAPGVAGYYERLLDRNACLQRGRRIATPPILTDAISTLSLLAPVILESGLPGFGPKRFKHTLGLAVEHARASRAVVRLEARKAGASESKSSAVDEARGGYRYLHGLLDSAIPTTGELRAVLDTTHRRRGRSIPEVAAGIQSLEVVADNLFARAAEDPDMAVALDDMGVTPDEVEAASEKAARVHTGSRAHNASKAELQSAWDALNTLDGVMWSLLEQLRDAAERARHAGRRVPEVRLTHIEAAVARSRGSAETEEPAAPVTPTPATPTDVKPA